jgi:hypothetical protein
VPRSSKSSLKRKISSKISQCGTFTLMNPKYLQTILSQLIWKVFVLLSIYF